MFHKARKLLLRIYALNVLKPYFQDKRGGGPDVMKEHKTCHSVNAYIWAC